MAGFPRFVRLFEPVKSGSCGVALPALFRHSGEGRNPFCSGARMEARKSKSKWVPAFAGMTGRDVEPDTLNRPVLHERHVA